jgi:ABC-type antimicrobial peptide transport system permease subunit
VFERLEAYIGVSFDLTRSVEPERVSARVVSLGFVLADAGVAIGTGTSLAGVSALEGLLFGVSPFDAASFVLVVTVILAVALLACWWPTTRALAVDPAEVLRSG